MEPDCRDYKSLYETQTKMTIMNEWNVTIVDTAGNSISGLASVDDL